MAALSATPAKMLEADVFSAVQKHATDLDNLLEQSIMGWVLMKDPGMHVSTSLGSRLDLNTLLLFVFKLRQPTQHGGTCL